jgi:tellurite resistance protein
MTSRIALPMIPAALFGVVLGVAGLGFDWRSAHRAWGLPSAIGETILAVAAIIWAILLVLYAAKCVFARDVALVELGHPVQCCFFGLIGVATLLIAGAALPYSRAVAWILFAPGALFTLGFALWRTGLLWHGERDPATTTAVLYLPAVAGSFVTAIVVSALGYPDWGQLAFGAGLFSWIAIESVLLHRLYTGAAMPAALRPTLGLQLSPPVIGAVAYLYVTDGTPDIAARALLGYGILQALLLLRLLPWVKEQRFAASYWAFSFGVTALANAPLVMVIHGETGAVAELAPVLFCAANLVVGLLAIRSLMLLPGTFRRN